MGEGAGYAVQNTPRIVWFSMPTYLRLMYEKNYLQVKFQAFSYSGTIVGLNLKFEALKSVKSDVKVWRKFDVCSFESLGAEAGAEPEAQIFNWD